MEKRKGKESGGTGGKAAAPREATWPMSSRAQRSPDARPTAPVTSGPCCAWESSRAASGEAAGEHLHQRPSLGRGKGRGKASSRTGKGAAFLRGGVGGL